MVQAEGMDVDEGEDESRLTLTHHGQRKQRMRNCLNNALTSSGKIRMLLGTNLLFRNTRMLLRRLPDRYKHIYARLIITHERRYTRLKQIKRNIIRRHGILLVRKRSHPYKHACARHMTTYKNRCTRSQKIKVNIIECMK